MDKYYCDISNDFGDIFGSSEGLRFFSAPGRVNIIGEHIDYCGGLVMPVALSKKTTVAARPNGTDIVRLAATDMPGRLFSFDIKDIEKAKELPWGNYQAGIFKEFSERGVKLCGLDMLFDCTVPFGAGLSSSASIELATAAALNEIFHAGFDNISLAVLSRHSENTFCGVNCGIMDQFASAMGKKDHAIMLDCATLRYEYIPLELGDHVLVLANTKAKHSLGSSKYNERRREADEALSDLQKVLPRKQLCDYTPEDYIKYSSSVKSEIVRKRAEHIIFENARVREAAQALRSGDLILLGKIMRTANDSIRYLYEATGDELDAMFDAAKGLPYCIGSRMTGGGFGGCTVNIVESSRTDEFISVVGKKYTEKTGIVPEFYICESGNGAKEEQLS